MTEQETKKDLSDKRFLSKGELISFAYDLGFSVVVPLLIFALSGRFLDKKFATSPLFLIIGLLLSLISTSFIVYKKVKKVSGF